jgi:hypothetical protein
METSQLESTSSPQRGYALGIDIGGTFTDVVLLSSLLNSKRFAGGAANLDVSILRTAMATLAAKAGTGAVELAWGIRERVNEEFAGAGSARFAELSEEPRQFLMLTYGCGKRRARRSLPAASGQARRPLQRRPPPVRPLRSPKVAA